MGVSALKQVKASAGSGKTYRLTRRFLDLLKGCRDPDPVSACAAAKAGGFSWSEILAVTFTNKAATEMKERLVRALKACALGIDPDELSTALPQARARGLLEVILRRYHLLNIRTIDSLQVLLLRLFALQFGLNPDFEMVFDEDQRIFEPVFTRFLERLEKAKGRDLLAEAVESMILHGRARGFWVQERLGESLKGLVGHLRADPGPYVTERSLMLERLERGRRDLLRAVKRLLAVMRELNLKPVANFSNFLDKCLATESCSRPPDSEYAAKAGLRDCLLKESKDLVGPRADTAFAEFKTALSEYAYAQAVLGGALELLPCLTMARELARDLDRFQKSHGLEPISCLARDAADLLSPGLAVPEAYCRLGCRLQHLLIDEFQDTSRLQWAALTPLAEECLAKGGSLFYVGDVKQAIYAWRGGDAELFDQVLAQPGLAELAEDPQTEPLPHNWRSRREIVEFNNRFFSKFADQERISELAAEVLAKAPREAVDDLARSLARQYRDVVQTIPPDRPGLTGGYVRMERLPGGPKDEVARQTLSAMDKVLDRLAARDRLKDTVILVRKHDEAEMLCGHLVSRGLPVITESSLRLDREPAVRQLAALLAFLDRPEDDLAFVELVCGEVFLGAAELDPDQVLDWLAQGNKSPLHTAFRTEFPEAWERFLEPFLRKSGLMLPYDLAVEATAGFRVLKRRPEAELYVKRFLEVVHLAGERGLGSLPAFLDYWREHSGEEKVPLPENLDAVRILTMHKAKGLEFPVVVVPFHNWPKGRDRDFAGADLDGARYLTRLAKGLGEPYFNRLGRDIREEFNLLYVSWTRAKDELYGFFPAKAQSASPALRAVRAFLDMDDLNPVLELGPRPPVPDKAPPRPERPGIRDSGPAPTGPLEFMSWLPRLRVHRHLEEASLEGLRGEAVHKALERLNPALPGQADPNAAVRLALEDFPRLRAAARDIEAQFRAMADWLLSREDLRRWLAVGSREAAILDAEGEVHRPDLVVRGPEETVVVEYKTGRPEPGHPAQVRRYLGLIRAMQGPGPAPRGVLVYLDQKTTVGVKAGDV